MLLFGHESTRRALGWSGSGGSGGPSIRNSKGVREWCRGGESLLVSEIVEIVDSPTGRARVAAALAAGPFPQYEPHPKRRGLLVRIAEDGTRTVGRFVGRRFQPAGSE